MNKMNKINQMNQVIDDEINLFELFSKLWDGKWMISMFVVIAVLLGGIFLFNQKAQYESKLVYNIDLKPPFYSNKKVANDFHKKFYSMSIFAAWKKSNRNTPLLFEDFSMTSNLNGFILTKNVNDQMVSLEEEKKNDRFVIFVKSNQLSILDNFFKYAEYVSKLMKTEYVNRAKDELNILETRSKNFPTATVISQILTIDRYIVSAEQGANVLVLKRPTLPKKTSPSSTVIVILSIILGGIVGIMYVLISSATRDHKQKLTKA